MNRTRSIRPWAAGLLGLALLGGCTSFASAGAGGPGADGIGDPYFPTDGNGGYDVSGYALDLRYDPATDTLTGEATIQARATQGLSAFNLDFQGLEISAVTVDGADADTTRDGAELTITPAEPLDDGSDFTTVVAYAGSPETLEDDFGEQGFFHTSDGALVAGQPDGAATWFPVNDHPRDAASLTVSITVPDGLEAISNGELLGNETVDGETTWHWSAEQPMAPYLMTLAIGQFDITSAEVDGIRYWNAIDPALQRRGGGSDGSVASLAAAAFDRQPEILAVLADTFGPYPFDVAGGIVDDVPRLGFALETQTRPVYSPVFFDSPESSVDVVVHELAHQWAGDDVRLDAWQHIWLNEGFATYAEWLWAEHEGTATLAEQFDDIARIDEDDEFWDVPIGDPGAASADLFADATYDRGAATLYALREEIGNADFADLVRQWFATESGNSVTTDDFIALAEDVSGDDLGDFFAEWLDAGKPAALR